MSAKKAYAICAILFIALIFLLDAISAHADTRSAIIIEDGTAGEFEYPYHEEKEFVVWQECKNGKIGIISGKVTAKTIIKVVNYPSINKSNLELLSGKPIVCYGKFRQTSKGEGTQVFCESLTIFVVKNCKTP